MADKKGNTQSPPQRTSPTPLPGLGQIGTNIASNWHPIDWAKETAGSLWQAVRHPVDTAHGLDNALQAASDLKAAAWQARSGKWPSGYTNADRKRASQLYSRVAPYVSYVDPKTNTRYPDVGAMVDMATKSPMDILATLATFGDSALASIGLKSSEVAAASKAAGSVRRTALAQGTADVANVGSKILKGTAIGLNPVPVLASKTLQVVAPRAVRFVKGGTKVLDQNGQFTPQVQAAFARQGIDTAVFDTAESRAAVERVLRQKGLSEGAIREARGAAVGVPVTRSMALQESPPRRVADDTNAVRTAGQGQISGQMETGLGAASDTRDLGSSFARAYTNTKNAVTDAYTRAFRQPGVFTNTADFASGTMQSVERELNSLGLSVSDVMSNPRFAQTQRALGGFRREGRTFGGLESQLNDLAGAPAAAPAAAINDLSGVPHTRGPNGSWVDPSGTPVTAPGKISYLDQVERSMPAPAAPSAGVNRLTPQSIDSVRRNNNAFYSEASTPEDRNVLAAINRGLDNYVESNAANFSGDGAALSRNLQDARTANQSFMQNYSQSTNKAIRDASSIVERNSALDPNGRIQFNGNPADIDAHFSNRIINPNTLATPTNYTGANTVTGDRMFSDLNNVLDPDGQQALTNHVRNTIATSPAGPAEVTSAANRYNFIFTPEETNLLGRLQSGRGVITDPALGPSTLSEGRFAPTVRRILASGTGSWLGTHIPIVGPVMGGMLTTGLDDAYELSRLRGVGSSEFSGAPTAAPRIPSLTAPLQVAGGAANLGQNGAGNLLPQQAPAPQPQKPAPAPSAPADDAWVAKAWGDSVPAPAAPSNQFSYDDIFGNPAPNAAPQVKPPSALKPKKRPSEPDQEFLRPDMGGEPDQQFQQPEMYRGGRTAYKSGGKVGDKDIEPLIQALMSKAKKAKKVSNKATEPLLNAHDSAIASALAVAQKSI